MSKIEPVGDEKLDVLKYEPVDHLAKKEGDVEALKRNPAQAAAPVNPFLPIPARQVTSELGALGRSTLVNDYINRLINHSTSFKLLHSTSLLYETKSTRASTYITPALLDNHPQWKTSMEGNSLNT